MKRLRSRSGRPPKYGRPSHAITVTLPKDVFDCLRRVDLDVGRAIVRLVERQRDTRSTRVPSAELAVYGNHAVIIVNPANAVKRLPGVQLVPTGNGRALISLDRPNSISKLELEMRDALDASDIAPWERKTLEAIADILRHARRTPGVSLKERSIIVLESKRQHRHAQ